MCDVNTELIVSKPPREPSTNIQIGDESLHPGRQQYDDIGNTVRFYG